MGGLLEKVVAGVIGGVILIFIAYYLSTHHGIGPKIQVNVENKQDVPSKQPPHGASQPEGGSPGTSTPQKTTPPALPSQEQLGQNLKEAISAGNVDEVKRLIANGADIDIEYKNRILIPAVYKNEYWKVKAALAAGADPNIQGTWPLLHFAAQSGDIDVLRVLIEGKADVNKNKGWLHGFDGSTALMYAAKENKTDSAMVLLNAGANVNIRNNAGKTALSLAREKEKEAKDPVIYQRMIKILLDAGAIE